MADAAVTSVPDIEAGELPLAWVVLKPGKNATENEIVKFVNGMYFSYFQFMS